MIKSVVKKDASVMYGDKNYNMHRSSYIFIVLYHVDFITVISTLSEVVKTNNVFF